MTKNGSKGDVKMRDIEKNEKWINGKGEKWEKGERKMEIVEK